MPSSPNLSGAEIEMIELSDREKRLKRSSIADQQLRLHPGRLPAFAWFIDLERDDRRQGRRDHPGAV